MLQTLRSRFQQQVVTRYKRAPWKLKPILMVKKIKFKLLKIISFKFLSLTS
jgi:hypothetical protein